MTEAVISPLICGAIITNKMCFYDSVWFLGTRKDFDIKQFEIIHLVRAQNAPKLTFLKG